MEMEVVSNFAINQRDVGVAPLPNSYCLTDRLICCGGEMHSCIIAGLTGCLVELLGRLVDWMFV